jgi:hypothetical protein
MEGTLKQQLPYASIFLRYFMLKLRRRKKITYFVVNRIEKNFFFFFYNKLLFRGSCKRKCRLVRV